MRIGIDVGGTHTDAILLDGRDVVASHKALTSADISEGILNALEVLLDKSGVLETEIEALMLGTTQFTNAVVERREMLDVAAIRLALPSGAELPPKVGWPEDLSQALGDHVYMLNGGYLYDGRPLAPMDDHQMDAVVRDIREKGIRSVAISSAFSPMNPEPELMMAQKLRKEIPDAHITLSHEIGRLGILERENATILNSGLLNFSDRIVTAFQNALKNRGLRCPLYISQNDGTLMDADFVRKYPALTFASGPTNSLRGAAHLTGIEDAIVVDIGGTTTDIGVLQGGFPRESNSIIEVGGVRTNFRMPDILALGLGGGSLVSDDGLHIGPQSVGHRLVTEGLIFGGGTLTATDIVVAAGAAKIGSVDRVATINPATIMNARKTISSMLANGIDRMKTSNRDVPVILVGGGSILAFDPIPGVSKMIQPKYADVANAIGAAIAKIGGEVERLVCYKDLSREEAIHQITQEARAKAISAGADPETIQIVEIEETPTAYMADASARLKVKVVGEIAALSPQKKRNTVHAN